MGVKEVLKKQKTGVLGFSSRTYSNTTDGSTGIETQENSDPTPPNTSNPENQESDDSIVLRGAQITAYATSIFQRLRLLDGINFK